MGNHAGQGCLRSPLNPGEPDDEPLLPCRVDASDPNGSIYHEDLLVIWSSICQLTPIRNSQTAKAPRTPWLMAEWKGTDGTAEDPISALSDSRVRGRKNRILGGPGTQRWSWVIMAVQSFSRIRVKHYRKLKTGPRGETTLVRNRDHRAGPTRDRTDPEAHVAADASTGGPRASSETCWVLSEGGAGWGRPVPRQARDRSIGPVYPSTCRPAGRADQGWGGRLSVPLRSGTQAGQRAVRTPTRRPAQPPRHEVGRVALGGWGGALGRPNGTVPRNGPT
jgi:hypothetical protein